MEGEKQNETSRHVMENTEMSTAREWKIHTEEVPWRLLNTLLRHWGGGHWKLDFNVVLNVPEPMQRWNVLPGHLETAHWSLSLLILLVKVTMREKCEQNPEKSHRRLAHGLHGAEVPTRSATAKFARRSESSHPPGPGASRGSLPCFRSSETRLPSTRHRFWAESQDGFCLFVCIFFLIQARRLWGSEALWQGPSLRHVAATGAASKDSLL